VRPDFVPDHSKDLAGYCSRTVNMAISLAFLAPILVKAAVEGRLPRGIGIERLRDPNSSSDEIGDPLSAA
jgi:hypothetical protein